MRLALLVSGELGFKILDLLAGTSDVTYVMTDARSIDIQQFCKDRSMSLFVGNPRNGRAKKFLEDKKADVLLSVNYLFIVDKDVIDNASLAINLHGSLLPKYRGRTPHIWAIINNEKFAGVTAHLFN